MSSEENVSLEVPVSEKSPEQLAEIEKAIQDKVESSQEQMDPFDTAVTMHGFYKGIFENHLKALSTGQLRRLCNALVQYPVNDKEFIGDESKVLKDAFVIGQRLMQALFIMFEISLTKYHEQQLNEQQLNERPFEENKQVAEEQLNMKEKM